MDQRVNELLFDIEHMSDIESVPPRISSFLPGFLPDIFCQIFSATKKVFKVKFIPEKNVSLSVSDIKAVKPDI